MDKKQIDKLYRENNKEALKEKRKAYRLKNKVHEQEYSKQYHLDNKSKRDLKKEHNKLDREAKVLIRKEESRKKAVARQILNNEKRADVRSEYYKSRYSENSVSIKKRNSDYHKNNRHITNAISAKRRSRKISALSGFNTVENLDQIKLIYEKCRDLTRETGVPHHVDHIVALQGKTVCGLHVFWNLQILTAEENIKKGNRLYKQ